MHPDSDAFADPPPDLLTRAQLQHILLLTITEYDEHRRTASGVSELDMIDGMLNGLDAEARAKTEFERTGEVVFTG